MGLQTLIMKNFLFLITLVTAIISCGGNSGTINKEVKKEYTARVFEIDLNKYGYEISKNNNILIRQTVIPGMHGNHNFSRKQDAKKVADLVINKLDNGISPPSITGEEIDSLDLQLNAENP